MTFHVKGGHKLKNHSFSFKLLIPALPAQNAGKNAKIRRCAPQCWVTQTKAGHESDKCIELSMELNMELDTLNSMNSLHYMREASTVCARFGFCMSKNCICSTSLFTNKNQVSSKILLYIRYIFPVCTPLNALLFFLLIRYIDFFPTIWPPF